MRRPFLPGWITIVLLLESLQLVYGQKTAVLTGYVSDAMTGQPMPFAHVFINGSTQGAVTDEKGYYTLPGVPPGTVEIAAGFCAW